MYLNLFICRLPVILRIESSRYVYLGSEKKSFNYILLLMSYTIILLSISFNQSINFDCCLKVIHP